MPDLRIVNFKKSNLLNINNNNNNTTSKLRLSLKLLI